MIQNAMLRVEDGVQGHTRDPTASAPPGLAAFVARPEGGLRAYFSGK